MELRQLSTLTNINKAIYGLEAAGVDGTTQAFNRVEDLAQFHVNNIISIQSEGPYYLVGYCFGGLVAVEMASILSKAGKTIALLALIDSFPHVKYLPLRCRLAGTLNIFRTELFKIPWLPVLRHYTSIARSLPIHSRIRFILLLAWRVLNFPFNQLKLGLWISRYSKEGPARSFVETKDLPLPINLRMVRTGLVQAFESYKPKYYPNELTFIKAEGTKFFDAHLFWDRLCAKLTIHVVEGDHDSVVKEDPGPLALVLTACVQKVSEAAATHST